MPAQPALSARLLPTPAQIRFYVHATTTPPLPKLRTIDHELALRISTIAADEHVHWALLAAVARVESRLGGAQGPIAGKRLPTVPAGQADQLRALAKFLHDNGANRNLSAQSTQEALKTYFGSETRAGASAPWPPSTARSASAACSTVSAGTAGSCASACCTTAPPHLSGWPGRHPRPPRRPTRADHRRVPRERDRLRARLESRQRPSPVHGLRRRQRARLRPRGRRDRGRRHAHQDHQGPGSVTERTVRLLLLLPQRMRPRQIVSLMDVDGPTGNHGSFALPDHSNRIQIG